MKTVFSNLCIADPELVNFVDRQGEQRSYFRANLLDMNSYETYSMTVRPELAKALADNPTWLHTPLDVVVDVRNFKGKWSLKIIDVSIDGNSLASMI